MRSVYIGLAEWRLAGSPAKDTCRRALGLLRGALVGWARLVAATSLLALSSIPAAAQSYAQPGQQPYGLGGYLQGLFGSSQPAPYVVPPSYGRPPALDVPHLRQPQMPRVRKLSAHPSDDPSGDEKSGQARPAKGPRTGNASASLGGGLRTMCVRLCDGYYWPMTFDAKRSRFDHDAKVCSASCASEARAFVMPNSGEAKDMTDQQGRSYTKLANAFRYRKGQVMSCSCRPAPWDDEARARHQGFAVAANQTRLADARLAVAGSAADAGRGDATPPTASVESAAPIPAGVAAAATAPADGASDAGVTTIAALPASKPASAKTKAARRQGASALAANRPHAPAMRMATPAMMAPGRGYRVDAGYPPGAGGFPQPSAMPYRAY